MNILSLRLARGLLRDRLEHGVQSAWRVGSQDLLVPVSESLNTLVSWRSLLSSLVQIILASFICYFACVGVDAWGESIFLISLSERGSAREPPSCCLGEELLKIFSRGQAPFSWITYFAPHEFWVLVREIPEEENKEHFREVFFRCPRRSVQGLVPSLCFFASPCAP